ncbi:MAG TPA: hypothetical protein VGK27_08545 [Candidatus Deferrimicrobiaceae bacterium]|jgi:hypothetical protein
MVHPHGGSDCFFPKSSFKKAYRLVGKDGFRYLGEGNEEISVYQGQARDGVTPTIVFRGADVRHGSVCEQCWGYRLDCNRVGIGKFAEPFDEALTKYPG